MRKTLAWLLVLTVVAAAVWVGILRPGTETAATDAAGDAAQVTHDFEAEDVVLRQMDATGRLQYEVVAERIAQLPDGGAIRADRLTVHHDPRDTSPGGPGRWTLTAAQGELPDTDGTITLSGGVHVKGVPAGRISPVQLKTDKLRYDLASEEFSTDAEVELTMGRYKARGGLLRGNVATNEWALESGVHGTISR